MSKVLLQKVINKGTCDNLNVFFQDISKYYAEFEDDLSNYDDDQFANFQAVGEIVFNPNEKLVVVTADIAGDLTERSGKKAQYEKAKKILKSYTRYDAGIFVFSDSVGNFRFSLVYGTPDATRLIWSNFRRFTYFVSRDQTNNTFLDRIGNCAFSSLEIIKDAFSVEKVNKEFYIKIAEFFYRLTGKNEYKKEMILPSVSEDDNKTYEEFAVRLIGRSIFCWFLKHKKSAEGIPLIAKEALSVAAVQNHSNYYHSISEQLFFELMNTPIKDRQSLTIPDADKVPFLNGGLFEPHENDFYKPSLINVLKIPNKWFIDFFTVLEQYNFTIDENSTVDADVSVDPEMLGRIFENLLAEVNPITGETARKATGSYYTPRTIVDYMVEQSLKQYLITKTSLSEDKIANLLSYDDNPQEFNPAEKEAVVKASKEMRIIDPACGSGAFPMGILHRMLLALEKVDPKLEIWRKLYLNTYHPVMRKIIEDKLNKGNEHYIRKLTLIQDSIYGVDIQPIAVEISKLRCFLSLVVDELVFDNEDNRGIEPLPNLEFKFIAANSLLGLPKAASQSAFGITDTVNKLKELRETYLSSFATDKKLIEKEFRATQLKLFNENVAWAVSDILVKQLTEWDPFSYESCKWFDPEWMFGMSGGFDIVIANPPYIKEYINRFAFDGVRESPYYQGKMDIWYLFACTGIDRLKSNGVLTLIAQNNWVTSFGASKLRNKVIGDTKILALLDFGDYKIFEASGIQTMVMVFQKDKTTDNYKFDYRRCFGEDLRFDNVVDLLDYKPSPHNEYLTPLIQRSKSTNTTLTFNASANENIIKKICSKANLYLTESEVANGIHHHHDIVNKERLQILGHGFEVGDGIFVLSNKEKQNIGFLKNELDLIKPSYTTKDLRKWYGNQNNNEWVIYTDSSFKNPQNIKSYPNLKAHLDKFREVITSDNWPYGLHRAREERFFKGEKIVAVRKCAEPSFTYTDFDCYVSATFYVIKTERLDLKYLTALLNSKLIAFWLKNKGKMQGTNYQIDKEPLLAIPLHKPKREEQQPIITLVEKIISIMKDDVYLTKPANKNKVKELEGQIDDLVYELYGLAEDEKTVVMNCNTTPEEV